MKKIVKSIFKCACYFITPLWIFYAFNWIYEREIKKAVIITDIPDMKKIWNKLWWSFSLETTIQCTFGADMIDLIKAELSKQRWFPPKIIFIILKLQNCAIEQKKELFISNLASSIQPHCPKIIGIYLWPKNCAIRSIKCLKNEVIVPYAIEADRMQFDTEKLSNEITIL